MVNDFDAYFNIPTSGQINNENHVHNRFNQGVSLWIPPSQQEVFVIHSPTGLASS